MQNSIFYVKDDSNKNLVAAKFLYNGGAPVLDPNFDKAESEHIFDSNGDLLPAQNIHGYLIVPSDYSVQNAVKFARSVSDEMTITVEGPDGQEMTGFGPALEMMAAAFFSKLQQAVGWAERSEAHRSARLFCAACGIHFLRLGETKCKIQFSILKCLRRRKLSAPHSLQSFHPLSKRKSGRLPRCRGPAVPPGWPDAVFRLCLPTLAKSG